MTTPSLLPSTKCSDAAPKRGHVSPAAPLIPLSGPGRLRTAHVLALCGISHSTLYARQKAGKFPLPDGKDGGLNYWNTATIREHLAQHQTPDQLDKNLKNEPSIALVGGGGGLLTGRAA